LIRHRHGLILIVGATGHGKTTTLAAVNQLFGADRKIISLEDPIEIVQPGVEQRWVDGQSEHFSEHIKIALREDPDVISISEIRDAQTAQAALMAALTGHLVTATLHAHDCIGAIQRLTNLGLRINELIATGVLQGIIAQHLVHRGAESLLVAEYVLMDHPARRFLRREDYSGCETTCVSRAGSRWRHAGVHNPALAAACRNRRKCISTSPRALVPAKSSLLLRWSTTRQWQWVEDYCLWLEDGCSPLQAAQAMRLSAQQYGLAAEARMAERLYQCLRSGRPMTSGLSGCLDPELLQCLHSGSKVIV